MKSSIGQQYLEETLQYGFSKSTQLSSEQAVEKITAALMAEGFGVLTTIDVQDTFKKKLNLDFKKYVILGACNPQFAHSAIEAEEEIGLLLPCNVIVYEGENTTVVSVFNPMIMAHIIKNDRIVAIAEEVTKRLKRALANI